MIDRRDLLLGTVAAAASLTASSILPSRALTATGSLRLSTVKYGSLNWLVETIRRELLAESAGLDLEIVEVATNQAGPVALLADGVDIIVSDWTWAMRQRSLGEMVKFSPYSSSLGGVMVHGDGKIGALGDLAGKKLGVAGSSVDKSWLLLRAYAKKTTGKDLADFAQPVFGTPPLLSEEFRSRRLDAVLNFWTYTARLVGEGHVELVGMDEVIAGLGIAPVPALVGFVWKARTAKQKAAELEKFFKIVSDANVVLASSDEAWEHLRPLVRPKTESEFAAIKKAYRAGIPEPWTQAETGSAQELFNLLVELGEQELVGHGTRFDAGLFHTAG